MRRSAGPSGTPGDHRFGPSTAAPGGQIESRGDPCCARGEAPEPTATRRRRRVALASLVQPAPVTPAAIAVLSPAGAAGRPTAAGLRSPFVRHYLNIHIFALLLGFAVLAVLAMLGVAVGISPIPQLLLGLSILAASYNLGHSLLDLWSAEQTRRKDRPRSSSSGYATGRCSRFPNLMASAATVHRVHASPGGSLRSPRGVTERRRPRGCGPRAAAGLLLGERHADQAQRRSRLGGAAPLRRDDPRRWRDSTRIRRLARLHQPSQPRGGRWDRAGELDRLRGLRARLLDSRR